MIDFIKKRRFWYSFSLVIILIGVISMISNYRSMNHIFNLGIDFTSGTSIILRFDSISDQTEDGLRKALNQVDLNKHTIQTSGNNDIVIKTEEMDVEKRNQLFDAIKAKLGKVTYDGDLYHNLEIEKEKGVKIKKNDLLYAEIFLKKKKLNNK